VGTELYAQTESCLSYLLFVPSRLSHQVNGRFGSATDTYDATGEVTTVGRSGSSCCHRRRRRRRRRQRFGVCCFCCYRCCCYCCWRCHKCLLVHLKPLAPMLTRHPRRQTCDFQHITRQALADTLAAHFTGKLKQVGVHSGASPAQCQRHCVIRGGSGECRLPPRQINLYKPVYLSATLHTRMHIHVHASCLPRTLL